MADMTDDLIENLRQPSQWQRIFFMLVFVFALWASSMVLMAIVAGQALFCLITGEDNDNLRELGASLTQYVNQILRFLTYNSQDKPFPFSPFPDLDLESAEKRKQHGKPTDDQEPVNSDLSEEINSLADSENSLDAEGSVDPEFSESPSTIAGVDEESLDENSNHENPENKKD